MSEQMVSEQRIAEHITGFLEARGKAVPDTDYELFDNQVIDSMELLELIMSLEQDLGIALDQELMTMDNFRTVNAIVRTVSQQQGTAAA